MPVPEPKKNESDREFISRCIRSLTKSEPGRFPTREQRAAVCYSEQERGRKREQEK